MNFNLKFSLRLAAVKPAVKPRTFETFRGPTTGCTLTRCGPGRNITRTLRTPRTADKTAVKADRPRAAGGLNFAVGPRAGKNRPRVRRNWPRGQGVDPERSFRGPDAGKSEVSRDRRTAGAPYQGGDPIFFSCLNEPVFCGILDHYLPGVS